MVSTGTTATTTTSTTPGSTNATPGERSERQRAIDRRVAERRRRERRERERAAARRRTVTVRVTAAEPTYLCVDRGPGTNPLFGGTLSGRRTFRGRRIRLNVGLSSTRVVVNLSLIHI